jgi:hypothetical protein
VRATPLTTTGPRNLHAAAAARSPVPHNEWTKRRGLVTLYFSAYEIRHHVVDAPGLRWLERKGLAGDIHFDLVEYAHGDPRTQYDEHTKDFFLLGIHIHLWFVLPGAYGSKRHPHYNY